MKVRITNERGYPGVYNHETGDPIEFVASADIHMGALDVTATLYFENPKIDVVCDAAIRETRHIAYDPNSFDSITAAIRILTECREKIVREAELL